MCGIAGVLSTRSDAPPPDRERLARMVAAIKHRGPDEFGMYRDARIGLAHARLSIVDLASGQQPLTNETGSLWVVFNGEIFNFVELREQLQSLGHKFRTRSDTEVIVHAWEAWGVRAFDRFNGQWAIALWDAPQQTLVLSRDRVGVRPLYYAEHAGELLFASEVKSLFADGSLPRAIDPVGLDETFTFWSVVAPRTPFVGVRELEPGHVLIADVARGVTRCEAFWRPEFPVAAPAEKRTVFPLSLDDATSVLAEKLTTATRLRIVRADVPVGSYLSGGLDSSLVASLGRESAQGAFKTFSLRFADSEYDETPFQREMVSRLQSDHAEIVVSRRDIAEAFPSVVYHTERPILRTAAAPLFLLSELVRRSGIKVVLTGEGADEMLGGYDLFREAKVRRFWAKHPTSRLRPRLFEKLYPYLARSPAHARGMSLKFWARGLEQPEAPAFSHLPRWESTMALKRLFASNVRAALGSTDAAAALIATFPPEFATWDPLARAQYLEIRTLLSGYLLSSQGDRMLMAHSVEGRFPFLDRDVMEFANALPATFKLHVLDEKHILKRVARGRIPDSIIARTKQPYRAPDALAFVGGGQVPEYVRELFSERALTSAGLLDPGVTHALYRKCIERGAGASPGEGFSNADNMAFVGALSTQLLHQQFVARPISAEGNIEWRTCIDRVPRP